MARIYEIASYIRDLIVSLILVIVVMQRYRVFSTEMRFEAIGEKLWIFFLIKLRIIEGI